MKESNPLVSVIIPFFDPPIDFMREAIESVFGQTYSEWELLLVNDGARPECVALAEDYAQKYPAKICLLQHPECQNLGISASRQLGILHSRGEYIAFLDADDVWLPNKLEEQAARLEAHPEAAMLYGNTLYWYSWTGQYPNREQDFAPQLGVLVEQVIQPPTLLPLFLSGKAAVPCTCSLLVRRGAFETNDGFEESFTGMYEDQVFYAKMCLSTAVYVSGLCLEKYRQHHESITSVSKKFGNLRESRLSFLKWLQGFLEDNEVKDSDVWASLRREMWLLREPGFVKNSQPARAVIKRVKKWLLKIEGWLLPIPIRRWIWAREFTPGFTSHQSH